MYLVIRSMSATLDLSTKANCFSNSWSSEVMGADIFFKFKSDKVNVKYYLTAK